MFRSEKYLSRELAPYHSTNVNCLTTSLHIDDLFGVNVYFDTIFILPSKTSNSFDHEERGSKMQMSFAIETNKTHTSSLTREKLDTRRGSWALFLVELI